MGRKKGMVRPYRCHICSHKYYAMRWALDNHIKMCEQQHGGKKDGNSTRGN